MRVAVPLQYERPPGGHGQVGWDVGVEEPRDGAGCRHSAPSAEEGGWAASQQAWVLLDGAKAPRQDRVVAAFHQVTTPYYH